MIMQSVLLIGQSRIVTKNFIEPRSNLELLVTVPDRTHTSGFSNRWTEETSDSASSSGRIKASASRWRSFSTCFFDFSASLSERPPPHLGNPHAGYLHWPATSDHALGLRRCEPCIDQFDHQIDREAVHPRRAIFLICTKMEVGARFATAPGMLLPSMRTCRSVAIDPKGGMFPIIGDRRITRLDCGRGALMLDNPEKTARLLAALKAAVPFKVELVPSLVTYLRAQHVAIADQTQHIVSNLSYAGDEGGIVCHIAPPDKEEALVVSLTQVRVPRSMPLAAAVADYHNHRVKKLKKQRMA